MTFAERHPWIVYCDGEPAARFTSEEPARSHAKFMSEQGGSWTVEYDAPSPVHWAAQ